MTEHWVEGETGKRRFRLKAGGNPINLTGLTVALRLVQNKDQTVVIDTSGDLTPVAPLTDGIVEFAPDAGDLLAVNSPMLARFLLTDVDGKTAVVPEGEPDTWIVRKI